MKTPIYKRITRTLAAASQLIIASPVRLPPKVVAIAKYVSLGVALLEAIAPDGTDTMPRVSTKKGKEAPPHGH